MIIKFGQGCRMNLLLFTTTRCNNYFSLANLVMFKCMNTKLDRMDDLSVHVN